jgi:glycosyltransferase involved in cell wall biosynthesis
MREGELCGPGPDKLHESTRSDQGLGKLLVFFDEPFFRKGEVVTTDRAFWLFVRALAPAFEHVFLLARIQPEPREAPYPCTPHHGFTLRELPYYASLYKASDLLRSFPRALGTAWRSVGESDALLLGVPHPFCLVLWTMATLRGKRAIFLDRQDLIGRVGLRAPGLTRSIALIAARALVGITALLARKTLTFAVGEAVQRLYARPGAPVHTLLISLVPAERIKTDGPRSLPEATSRRCLLWVGRIDPDKGLEVLLDAFRHLLERGVGDLQLDLVGSGLVEEEIRDRVRSMDLEERVDLPGYVPFGPQLEERYRSATVYVLPSNESEGFPQVLIEAMASGLPVVATAVSGIPYALRDGENALLVPPRDPASLCDAIERLLNDRALYEHLSREGLSFARAHSLEAQTAKFLRAAIPYLTRSGSSPELGSRSPDS